MLHKRLAPHTPHIVISITIALFIHPLTCVLCFVHLLTGNTVLTHNKTYRCPFHDYDKYHPNMSYLIQIC